MTIPSQENQMNSSSNILPASELKEEVQKQESNFKKLTLNQEEISDQV